MAEENTDVYGTWKIMECVSQAGVVETTGIEGTEFCLDKSGDVTWKIAEDTEPMAFFMCETFEIFDGKPPILKFFGTYTGHTIEFRVEVSDDFMLLTYEQWCLLQCQRVSINEPLNEFSFSLLGALEDGYFSDLTIVSESGKEFKVHKTILLLNGIDVDCGQPLSGLANDVLETILHYLYSECLPDDLTEETARNTQKALAKLAGFSRLGELCEIFLKNSALKQQIMTLVTDMHACANRVIDFFNGKGTSEPNHSPPGGLDNLRNNPAKLCYIVKQGLRETAVAGVKLLIVCDLFSKRKHELSRQERHDIIKYAMSRLPVFMNQLHKFLEVIRQTVGDLTPNQRHEIATYLVPEIESTLDLVSEFVVETKSALEHMISVGGSTDKSGQRTERNKRVVGEVLSRSLKNALHMRELMKLKHFHEKITIIFTSLVQKKESFNDMTTANKVRSIANNLACLDEIPVFLLRLEEVMSALHHKLTWKEWKYYFKLGTSKVAWILQKLVSHRSMLLNVILQTCDLVQREHFTQSVMVLGLFESTQSQEASAANGSSNHGSNRLPCWKTAGNKLNLGESLSSPPLSKNSALAQRAVQFLRLGQATDMVFEIVSVQDDTDTVIDHTRGEPVNRSTTELETQLHEIKAHRVIVAARCDWFRRALLSGMRESIDKKIVVHDTNPVLFRMFLEYLYEGLIETSNLSTEQLADLMLLSDQYEVDSLKQLCEHALKTHIDEGSALFLLGIADQLNVKALRIAALNFIVMNPDITESEVFFELPEEVQSEVEEEIARMEPWKSNKTTGLPFLVAASPSSVASSLEEIEELTTNMRLSSHETELSDSSSLEELPLTQDSARLEACVAQLKEIVGDDVKQEELVRISLAADYDVNRALNFFYAS